MRQQVKTRWWPVLLALVVLAGGSEALGAELSWNPYTKGMEQGQKLKKDIYINFYADWCHYCTQMESVTYRDKKVADYLGENFVLIKVDADRAQDLAEAYSVRGLPMGWFVSGEGEKIAPLPGYVDPDSFLTILKFVSTKSYNKMTFQEFVEKQQSAN
jgi:thioredoxin-related protein